MIIIIHQKKNYAAMHEYSHAHFESVVKITVSLMRKHFSPHPEIHPKRRPSVSHIFFFFSAFARNWQK